MKFNKEKIKYLINTYVALSLEYLKSKVKPVAVSFSVAISS